MVQRKNLFLLEDAWIVGLIRKSTFRPQVIDGDGDGMLRGALGILFLGDPLAFLAAVRAFLFREPTPLGLRAACGLFRDIGRRLRRIPASVGTSVITSITFGFPKNTAKKFTQKYTDSKPIWNKTEFFLSITAIILICVLKMVSYFRFSFLNNVYNIFLTVASIAFTFYIQESFAGPHYNLERFVDVTPVE